MDRRKARTEDEKTEDLRKEIIDSALPIYIYDDIDLLDRVECGRRFISRILSKLSYDELRRLKEREE